MIDLTDDDAVSAAVAEVEASHPRIQALVTCAGSSMLGDIDQVTMAEMRWLMDVNLWGTVNDTQALLPALSSVPDAHITHLVSIYGLAREVERLSPSFVRVELGGPALQCPRQMGLGRTRRGLPTWHHARPARSTKDPEEVVSTGCGGEWTMEEGRTMTGDGTAEPNETG